MPGIWAAQTCPRTVPVPRCLARHRLDVTSHDAFLLGCGGRRSPTRAVIQRPRAPLIRQQTASRKPRKEHQGHGMDEPTYRRPRREGQTAAPSPCAIRRNTGASRHRMITRGTTAMTLTRLADAGVGQQLQLSRRVLPTGEAVRGHRRRAGFRHRRNGYQVRQPRHRLPQRAGHCGPDRAGFLRCPGVERPGPHGRLREAGRPPAAGFTKPVSGQDHADHRPGPRGLPGHRLPGPA